MAQPGRGPLLPVIHHSTDGRQPVDGEGLVGLPNDHGRDGNGGGPPAVTPLLVHKVQIAMHAGHLVRGEAVSAVVICGDRKGKERDEGFSLPRPPQWGQLLPRSHLSLPHPHPTAHLTLGRLHEHLSHAYTCSVPDRVSSASGGEAERSTCLSLSRALTLAWGWARVGPGYRAALGPQLRIREATRWQCFSIRPFYMGRFVGLQTPALVAVAMAKVSESSVKRLRGQESQRSRRRQDWNCGPHLTFRASRISPLERQFLWR